MNPPLDVDVTAATVEPSKVIVTVEIGLNPLPVTVTKVKTGPEVGLIEMVGLDDYLMLKSSIHSSNQPRLRQSSPKSYRLDLECLMILTQCS